MLISYSMPTPTAIALAGTSGSAWLTSDNGAACYDGKPTRKTRVRWASSGSPATTHYVEQDITLPLTAVRVCAMLGLVGVPAGAVIHVYGKRPADGGVTWNFGGQNTTTAVQMPDGTVGAWFVLPAGAAAVEKVGFRIYNNRAGATWATAATTYDIGELWAAPAVEIPIDTGFAVSTVDPSTVTLSKSSQPSVVSRSAYRQLSCAFSPQPSGAATVRGGGLANGMDWAQLEAVLRGRTRCVAIAQFKTAEALAATALYGFASEIGETQQIRGKFYRKPMQFQEIPAR